MQRQTRKTKETERKARKKKKTATGHVRDSGRADELHDLCGWRLDGNKIRRKWRCFRLMTQEARLEFQTKRDAAGTTTSDLCRDLLAVRQQLATMNNLKSPIENRFFSFFRFQWEISSFSAFFPPVDKSTQCAGREGKLSSNFCFRLKTTTGLQINIMATLVVIIN